MATNGVRYKQINQSYYDMKYRCYNPEHKNYRWYGAREITVCDEWLNDKSKFIRWALDNGWHKGRTIERIDVNGNYEPSNCTWIKKSEQHLNKQNTKRTA
jgi:hypothetical protein